MKNEKLRNTTSNSKLIQAIIKKVTFIVVLCLVLFTVYYVIEFNWLVSLALLRTGIFKETFGQFGDIFGFSNTVFSALTIILLAVGVLMQREELNETKKSLKLQNESTERQMFENIFFKLLESFTNLIKDIDLRDKEKNVSSTGRDSLREFANRVHYHCFEHINTKNYNDNYENFLSRDTTAAKSEIESFKAKLNNPNDNANYVGSSEIRNYGGGEELFPYFRTFYVILKFIDESSFDDVEKAKYVRIFRSTLSEGELMLIAYNCLSKYAMKKDEFVTKKLIEDYHLLEHTKDEKLKNTLIDNGLIDKSAFGIEDN